MTAWFCPEHNGTATVQLHSLKLCTNERVLINLNQEFIHRVVCARVNSLYYQQQKNPSESLIYAGKHCDSKEGGIFLPYFHNEWNVNMKLGYLYPN